MSPATLPIGAAPPPEVLSKREDFGTWNWTGKLKSDDHGEEFHAVLLGQRDGAILFHLCNGHKSLAGSMTKHELSTQIQSVSLARVAPDKLASRVRTAFDKQEKAQARLTRRADAFEVRVGTEWGKEFGGPSIQVEVAAIPLAQTSGTGSFLKAVVDRIAKSRTRSRELRTRRKDTELEVEDLSEAKKRFDILSKRKRVRMQMFADSLNDYKKVCREGH